MPNNRDDFSKTTIRKLAERVGYICSCPECNAFTVGASYEGLDKVAKVGQAAHICAAAPGGKRYDSSMTAEERKSIDNGIWLCNFHARLIDTDEIKYPVELLHEWKTKAETAAANRLLDTNSFSEYFSNNDSYSIERVFSQIVNAGDFDMLSIFINQYKNVGGGILDELVKRYQVIYDIYCDRSNLLSDLDEYCNSDKAGISCIAELCICFEIRDALTKLKLYVDESLKQIIEFILTENLLYELIHNPSKEKARLFEDYSETYIKVLSCLVYKQGLFFIKDENGKEFDLCSQGFFFECLKNSFDIGRDIVLKNKTEGLHFEFFIENADKISKFDISLQVLFYTVLLRSVLGNKNNFELVYGLIEADTKNEFAIKELFIEHRIINLNDIDVEEVYDFCSTHNDYNALKMFFGFSKKEKTVAFLDDHAFLYDLDFEFVIIRYRCDVSEMSKILEKTKNTHSECFGYKCIESLEYGIDNSSWLQENLDIMRGVDVKVYIDLLKKNKQFQDMLELSNHIRENIFGEELYYIARILQFEKFSLEKVLLIYDRLEAIAYTPQRLYYNKGLLYYEVGQFEKSKEMFKKEYDSTNLEEALIRLLDIRFRHNQCIDDEYLQDAKKSKNALLVAFYAQTIEKLHKPNAYKYFLRALLLDGNIENLPQSVYRSVISLEEVPKPSTVSENTVCVLENDETTICIAICENEIVEGINNTDLYATKFISKDDEISSSLMFCSEGETVSVLQSQFLLKEIIPLVDHLARITCESVLNDVRTIKITGATPEEGIEKITEFMKEVANESEMAIKSYNESSLKYPLSFLSKSLGRKKIISLEFLLYGNTEKLLNNLTVKETIPNNILLSYDSIVILTILDLFENVAGRFNLLCASQIVDQLLQDVSDEIADLESKSSHGFMSYKDDKINLVEYSNEAKRERYKYLTKIKRNIESIIKLDGLDYICETEGLNELFIQQQWLVEGAALASIKSSQDSILLTDDQFLYALAGQENQDTIGVLGLLKFLDLSGEQILDCCKKMSSINFNLYINSDLYFAIVEKIENSANSDELSSAFSEFLVSDKTGHEPTLHHIKVVYDMIKNIDINYVFQVHILRELLKYHFFKIDPEQAQIIVKNVLNEFIGG